MAYGQVNDLVVVVEDGQRLVEPVRHRALPDHRELRVDVHRAGAGDQEEPCLEVLQVVGGQELRRVPSMLSTHFERNRVS